MTKIGATWRPKRLTEDGEWQRLEKYRPRIKSDRDRSDKET